MESNRLVSSGDTCEQCHARLKAIEPRLRVFSKFNDDEAKTRTETVLMMFVGGGKSAGIHGAHLAPGVRIRYGPRTRSGRTIPWVEYRNSGTGVTRSYLAAGEKSAASSLPTFDMQCVDCHNRAAHVV